VQDEGTNEDADQYLGKPDTQDIPVDSKQSLEEQKVLQEANDKKNQVPAVEKKTENKEPEKPDEKKKKQGLFKRIFGKKNNN
jgi:penicillin-binding protein 1A